MRIATAAVAAGSRGLGGRKSRRTPSALAARLGFGYRSFTSRAFSRMSRFSFRSWTVAQRYRSASTANSTRSRC